MMNICHYLRLRYALLCAIILFVLLVGFLTFMVMDNAYAQNLDNCLWNAKSHTRSSAEFMSDAHMCLRRWCDASDALRKQRVVHLDKATCSERMDWLKEELLDYGISMGGIKNTADQNGIPGRLLMTVIANQLEGLNPCDYGQTYFGNQGASGIAQLDPERVLKHRLIQLKPEELMHVLYYPYDNPKGYLNPVMQEFTPHEAVWRRLIQPQQSIDLAAKEIVWILSEWNVALLNGYALPKEYFFNTMDSENIYQHIRDFNEVNLGKDFLRSGYAHDERKVFSKEILLAHAVALAYPNGARIIWAWDPQRHDSPFTRDINNHIFKKSLQHAANSQVWAECLFHQSWPDGEGRSDHMAKD